MLDDYICDIQCEDFYGDDAPAEDLFSTDIIVLTEHEKQLVNLLFKRLKKLLILYWSIAE